MKHLAIIDDFLDLVFPRTCCLCSRSLFAFEDQLCRICTSALPIANYHLRPFENDLSVKILGLTKVNRVMAFLRFTKKGDSQKLLHLLKYRNKPELGRFLGNQYSNVLKNNDLEINWDVIIPVPLHPLKQKRRGYNQSEQFALGLSDGLGIPISLSLIRTKFTETQTKKNRMERLKNVSAVFDVDENEEVKGRNVLLVDDVMTTGATLVTCANLLLEKGAVSVDMAVIAAGKNI